MTPSLPLDLRLPIVGRLKKFTGTHSRRVLQDLKAMLRALGRQARADPARAELLWDLKDGRRRLLDVLAAYEREELDRLPPTDPAAPLLDAVDAWLEEFPCSARYQQDIRASMRALDGLVQRATTVQDLPRLLELYRERQASHAAAFNRTRAHGLAFCREKHPRLYPKLRAVRSLRERKQGKAGLSVAEAVALRDRVSPRAGRAWWGMCLTGMNPKEFYGTWSVEADRVRIFGTKRLGRRWGQDARAVPLVDTPTRAELTLDGLTTALRKHGVTPGQGRKTFARWLEDAGVPRTRRKLYLGHGAKDVTDLYERHEISAFLREDAGRLRAVLGTIGLRVMK